MPDINPKAYIQPLAVRPRVSRPQPNGLPIINLSFNELPYPPSASVLDAIQAVTVQANRYGNPSCDVLRAAIGTTYQLNPDQIVCGNGSEELLDIIGRCYARAGDEIVISEYGYIQFPIVANRVGAHLVKAPENHLHTHIDNLLSAVNNKTRIVFIANPNNPTGTMVSVSELRRLAEQLSPQVVLVLDLAYGEFVSDNYIRDVHSLAVQFQNVITTQTFSKAFGLAGLRVGWCYAPEWMIPTLYAARGMGTVNAAAQAGAVAALENIDTVSEQITVIKTERERLTESLSSMGFDVTPSSANFLLMAVHKHETDAADELARHLFDHAGIVVNQTREAGLERFIRFSISSAEHNNTLLDSIQNFVEAA